MGLHVARLQEAEARPAGHGVSRSSKRDGPAPRERRRPQPSGGGAWRRFADVAAWTGIALLLVSFVVLAMPTVLGARDVFTGHDATSAAFLQLVFGKQDRCLLAPIVVYLAPQTVLALSDAIAGKPGPRLVDDFVQNLVHFSVPGRVAGNVSLFQHSINLLRFHADSGFVKSASSRTEQTPFPIALPQGKV